MATRSLARASAAALQCISSGFEANPLTSGSLSSSRLQPWALPNSGSQNGIGNDHALCGRTHCWFIQKFFMSTHKIRLKKDRSLDAVADREKALRPILRIRDLILKHKKDAIPLRFVTIKRRELGLKMSDMRVQIFMKKYPNFFEFFIHPEEKLPWCRLAKQVTDLLEEEKQILAQQEPLVVEKLRRLLMLSKNKRIRADKLAFANRYFGFPDDFLTSVVPKYPEFFRLVKGKGPLQTLELVAWDESLAITEFEKKAKENAREMGLGEIETQGRPLPFKFSYSPGMALRREALDRLDKWQKLPYISPYQDASWIEDGTPLAEKRTVALLHEVLSLTIEKKILIEIIGRYQEEFRLPQNVVKVFNRFPGIFYLSLKGAVHTIFLREAYHKWQLIEEHPLVNLKAKYTKLISDGPRMRSFQSKAWHAGKKGYIVNEGRKDKLSMKQMAGEENDDEHTHCVDEFSHPESDDEEESHVLRKPGCTYDSESGDEIGPDYGYDDAESPAKDEEDRRILVRKP